MRDSRGRQIAAYRFGDLDRVRLDKRSGRTNAARKIKRKLIEKHGSRCFIYGEGMSEAELQIDHRVPFEVGGDGETLNPDDFMLVCGSANRAKSWACEHCENWKTLKDKSVCVGCYWAFPENHSHVAMRPVRRIDLVWQGEEVGVYDELKRQADDSGKKLFAWIKEILGEQTSKAE